MKNKLMQKGQVAVIMIVAIAIGLVLFAASINLTLVSQAKTMTMKGATAASSLMASTIASYGERQWRETLGEAGGNPPEKCQKSRGGLIQVIVLIILIVITVVCWGGCAGFTAAAAGGTAGAGAVSAISAAALAAAVMQGIAITVSATTDPGISEAWNKMQSANLSQTGQFVERGIIAGIQGAVTDPIKIPDLYDQDSDGLYGFPGGDENQPPHDEISRFAHYITKRYLELDGPNTAAIEQFLDALHELVIDPGDNFAFMDPVYYPDAETPATGHSAAHPCYDNYYMPSPPNPASTLNPEYAERPAECDPCCMQAAAGDPNLEKCFDTAGAAQIGSRASCPNRTPFRATEATTYQYIYDPSYEDSKNSFLSLREQLGRDDEHNLYHTAPTAPDWHGNPFTEPQQLIIAPEPTGFFLKDVVGYYTAPGFANLDEWVVGNKPKLYPFLYKMRDWGANLSMLSYSDYECHYCDADTPVGPPPGRDCPADVTPTFPEMGRLSIAAPTPYSGGWCVDRVNRRGVRNEGAAIDSIDPPMVPDKVRGIPEAFAATSDCALRNPLPPTANLNDYVSPWKAGSDRYCSNVPETSYDLYCGKTMGNPEATCVTLGNGSQWVDDNIDEIIYGDMPALFDLERNLWKAASTSQGLNALAKELATWYGEVQPGASHANNGIADWIEPPCPSPSNCPGSYTKLSRPGRLYVWRAQFIAMRRVLEQWLVPPGDAANPKYVSSTCMGPDAAWCIPSNPCPGTVNNLGALSGGLGSEYSTFDANGNGQIGDVEDVMACLNWNANHTLGAATGNAQKFGQCFADCNQVNCEGLPRSLVPTYYDNLPLKFYPGHETLFNNCLASPLVSDCASRCSNTVLPSGTPYLERVPRDFVPPDNDLARVEAWCNNPDTSPNILLDGCNGFALDCAVNLAACRCSWANDCTLAGECGNLCPVGSFCEAVTESIPIAQGSCGDPLLWPDFSASLIESIPEANVQVAKFKHRLKFLDARFDEAVSIIETLDIAIAKITEFLDNDTPNNFTDSPAERFIQARIAPIENIVKDLPSYAVYVWQDKDPARTTNLAGAPRAGTGQGYWHAVKVEVRMPRRCAGNCLSEDLPKIDSRTSGGFFSKKVCYKLVNVEGMVKARVVRYDQDKDLTGLLFPGGAKIWESRMSNPLAAGAPDATNLRGTCASLIDADLAGWLGGATELRHLGAAFMLNKIPQFTGDNYSNCWLQVHNQLLAHGIMSESCAQYYFVEGQGFRVKFVPCDNW